MKLFIGALAVCFILAASAFSQGPSEPIDYETAPVADCHRRSGEEKTTMIYTHVLNRGGRGVRSPADNPDGISPPFPQSNRWAA